MSGHNRRMPEVIVVGAGRIGLPLIANLVRAGHLVHAVDVRPDREQPVLWAGARWAGSSVATVSATQVLLTVLPGSAELRAVMLGDPAAGPHAAVGVLSAMPAASTWIDCTSAAPLLGAELAAAAQVRGVDYLEAPLGGGVTAAEQATLSLYVGGSAELLARHRPLLEAIAHPDRIRHLGGHGAGYLAKLLVNQLWFGQAVAVGEALLLGQRAGLAPAVLSDVLESSPAASRFISDYLRPLLHGDYAVGFGLDRCVEELDAVEQLARTVASPFEVSAQVASLHREALHHFGPVDGELMAVAYLEHLAGRALANPAS
jgi:3-hydroxyisobutyrate dehydrogenase